MNSKIKNILIFVIANFITSLLFILAQAIAEGNIIHFYKEIIDAIKNNEGLNIKLVIISALFFSFIINLIYLLYLKILFKKINRTYLQSIILSISSVFFMYGMIIIGANSNGLNWGMMKGLCFGFIISFSIPYIYKLSKLILVKL